MHGREDWTILSQALNDLSWVTRVLGPRQARGAVASRGPDSSVTFPHRGMRSRGSFSGWNL